jgi:hypothetical protein
MRSSSGIGIRTFSLAVLTIAMGVAVAQTDEGQQHHRPPPPEALAACKSLSSGQQCSFTSRHGPMTGTCWAPEGKPLACRPKHLPAPEGSGSEGSPPPKQ